MVDFERRSRVPSPACGKYDIIERAWLSPHKEEIAVANASGRKRSKAASSDPDRQREMRHRLVPGRALRDLDDAASFLEEMGLLLQTPHRYLPSLFGAAQGKPYKPGVGGFGHWPAHAWSWAGELAERDDVLMTKVILGQRTLVHRRLWKALDSAVREVEPSTPDAMAIVNALRKRKEVRTDELPELAGFEGKVAKKRYDKAISQLQWAGTVICTPALVDNHKHVAIAQLWKTMFPKPLVKPHGPGEFIKAAVEAAGLAPEREVMKWFSCWPRATVKDAISDLVSGHELDATEGVLLSR